MRAFLSFYRSHRNYFEMGRWASLVEAWRLAAGRTR